MSIDTSLNYYSLDDIEKEAPDARYYVIFGERSNGKTFAVLERIVKNWAEKGEKAGYLRRYGEDIKAAQMELVFESIVKERDLVNELTNGEWTDIKFWQGKWFFAKWDTKTNRYVKQKEPFCYSFALSLMERNKGVSYPEVTTILFDEFMTRDFYLVNEFRYFQNVVSTIVRQRVGIKVYMLGNTVSRDNPYFKNMGIKEAFDMEIGTIATYKPPKDAPDSVDKDKVFIAVEYASSAKLNAGKGKKSDGYFVFEGNTSSMIISGEWDIPNYPPLPVDDYSQKHIVNTFYVDYDGRLYQGDILDVNDLIFVYVHDELQEVPETDDEIIYTIEFSPKLNHCVGIGLVGGHHRTELSKRIADLFKMNLVFYKNNDVGDMMRNYIMHTEKLNSTNL